MHRASISYKNNWIKECISKYDIIIYSFSISLNDLLLFILEFVIIDYQNIMFINNEMQHSRYESN